MLLAPDPVGLVLVYADVHRIGPTDPGADFLRRDLAAHGGLDHNGHGGLCSALARLFLHGRFHRCRDCRGNCLHRHRDRFGDCFHGRKVSFDFKNLDEVKAQYRAGGLGDVMVKNFLTAVLNDTLEPIRRRRKELEQDIPYVYGVLREGTEIARAAAAETLAEVKRAMKINYFEEGALEELIAEQTQKYQNL